MISYFAFVSGKWVTRFCFFVARPVYMFFVGLVWTSVVLIIKSEQISGGMKIGNDVLAEIQEKIKAKSKGEH